MNVIDDIIDLELKFLKDIQFLNIYQPYVIVDIPSLVHIDTIIQHFTRVLTIDNSNVIIPKPWKYSLINKLDLKSIIIMFYN